MQFSCPWYKLYQLLPTSCELFGHRAWTLVDHVLPCACPQLAWKGEVKQISTFFMGESYRYATGRIHAVQMQVVRFR
jgi:hypothetical protein